MVFGVISSNYSYLNLLENAERTARYLDYSGWRFLSNKN